MVTTHLVNKKKRKKENKFVLQKSSIVREIVIYKSVRSFAKLRVRTKYICIHILDYTNSNAFQDNAGIIKVGIKCAVDLKLEYISVTHFLSRVGADMNQRHVD